MQPGHVLLDREGAIVEADANFATLLMSPPNSLRGRNVVSFTAPADRDECTRAIERLWITGEPFDITKRFIRQDGSALWVRNSVSRMMVQAIDMIVATCAPVAGRPAHQTPGSLLESARLQAEMLGARDSIADPILLSGPSWPALLQVYIAEAEGRIVDVDMLSTYLQLKRGLVQRWVDALAGADILEVETRDSRPDTAKTYRLTASAVPRLEEYLGRFASLGG